MVERRLGALADDVRAQVRTPGFDTLAGRATRRRRRVHTTALVAAVAAVVGLVTGIDRMVGTSNAGREVTEQPDRGPGGGLTLEDIVHDPDAELIDFAVSASDPDIRAAFWSLCLDKWCNRPPRATVTVTDDGFETTTYVNPPPPAWDLTSIDADTFAMSSSSKVWLLDTDGATRRIPPADPAGPVRDGEVLVYTGPTGDDPLAVDPVSETANRLPMPAGDVTVQQTPDGRLWGSAARNDGWHAVWSTDGGAQWTERRMGDYPGPDSMSIVNIPSFAPDVMVYIEARNWVNRPNGTHHLSTDGGETWQQFPVSSLGDEGAAHGWRVVRPDGSLWVTPVGHRELDPGPYGTDGTDWSRLDLVDPGFPDEMQISGLTDLQNAGLDADGALVLYISDRDQQLFVSTDGGNTWELSTAR